MIRLQDLTPEVYYNQSRDFQFIGRLYDIVLNSVKTSADMIYSLLMLDSVDSKRVELLATTLGFKIKHNYSVKQLAAICSIFSQILKIKGTIDAVMLAGQALLNSEGILDDFTCAVKDTEPYLLQVYVPAGLSDTTLLKDLFDYVLPAGMSVNIVRTSFKEAPASTELINNTSITIYSFNERARSYLFDGSTITKPGITDQDRASHISNTTVVDPTGETSTEDEVTKTYNE